MVASWRRGGDEYHGRIRRGQTRLSELSKGGLLSAHPPDPRGIGKAAPGGDTDRRSQWIQERMERRGQNRTAVANKNVRRVWAWRRRGGVYRETMQ